MALEALGTMGSPRRRASHLGRQGTIISGAGPMGRHFSIEPMSQPPVPNPAPDGDADSGADGEVALAPGASVSPSALRFRQGPASGPGGQNVNRRHTRAELRVALLDIRMPVRARRRLRDLAGERMTADGVLIIVCEKTRSARRNQDEALERLKELVREAMVEPKRRIPTKPSRRSNERRLEAKRRTSERKRRRSGPDREG